jgi:hypothetical protein
MAGPGCGRGRPSLVGKGRLAAPANRAPEPAPCRCCPRRLAAVEDRAASSGRPAISRASVRLARRPAGPGLFRCGVTARAGAARAGRSDVGRSHHATFPACCPECRRPGPAPAASTLRRREPLGCSGYPEAVAPRLKGARAVPGMCALCRHREGACRARVRADRISSRGTGAGRPDRTASRAGARQSRRCRPDPLACRPQISTTTPRPCARASASARAATARSCRPMPVPSKRVISSAERRPGCAPIRT